VNYSSRGTMHAAATARQVTFAPAVTADVCSVQERAARVMQSVLAGASVPPSLRVRYRKWRDRGAQPSIVARFLSAVAELASLGVKREVAEQLVIETRATLDAAYAGENVVQLSLAAVEREQGLELDENIAAVRAVTEDTVTAHERAASTLRAEMAVQARRLVAHEAAITRLRGAR
jgi:hypothetical protein